ncbi:MAG: mechanosensitive ion channel family protein [Candidatus Eremiobacteraeota bacterium]|nr:mechanosensitive ion channel family protein [Candidatus Eremiobacteraeota bacterium]
MKSVLMRFLAGLVAFGAASAALKWLAVFPTYRLSISSLPGNHLAAIVLAVMWWLSLAWLVPIAADLALQRMFTKAGRPQTRKIVGDLTGIVAYFAAACAIAAFVFDFPVNTVFATSGIIAIVIGLALQNTLADVFSGIALNLEHPYRIGEWVSIGPELAGEVVETNWRSTHVQLRSRDILIIPNSIISKYRIVNHHRPTTVHKASVLINIDDSEQPHEVREILKSAARSASGVLDNPLPNVQIVSFNEDSIGYNLEFFVDSYARVNDIRTNVLTEVWAHMAWAGLKRPLQRKSIELTRAKGTNEGDRQASLAHLVGRIHVFESLSTFERTMLAKNLERRDVHRGAVLVEKGAQGDSLFVIGRGVLEVVTELSNGERHVVARLGPGQYFGEMSLLTGSPRSASVIALTDAVLYEVSKAAFEPFIAARPEIVEELGRMLATRADVLSELGKQHEQLPSGGALALLTQRIHAFFASHRLGKS